MVTERTVSMRKAFAGAIAAFAIITGLGVAPVQAAPAQCTTTIEGGTTGSLVVPEGATCTLLGVTVNGNVVVEEGASLFTNDLEGENTTIKGSVRGMDAKTVRIIDTDVIGQGTNGNINLQRTTGPIVIGSEGCMVDPLVGNNILLSNNLGTIAICMMTIGETIELKGNAKNIGVYDNVIGNSLNIANNTGDFIRVRRNEVGTTSGGSLNVKNNQSDVRLTDNNVNKGALACSGNTPPPSGRDNTADAGLKGQCSGLG